MITKEKKSTYVSKKSYKRTAKSNKGRGIKKRKIDSEIYDKTKSEYSKKYFCEEIHESIFFKSGERVSKYKSKKFENFIVGHFFRFEEFDLLNLLERTNLMICVFNEFNFRDKKDVKTVELNDRYQKVKKFDPSFINISRKFLERIAFFIEVYYRYKNAIWLFRNNEDYKQSLNYILDKADLIDIKLPVIEFKNGRNYNNILLKGLKTIIIEAQKIVLEDFLETPSDEILSYKTFSDIQFNELIYKLDKMIKPKLKEKNSKEKKFFYKLYKEFLNPILKLNKIQELYLIKGRLRVKKKCCDN
ncbi:hypothetical protein HERIO_670 [Hepatospora eriocheir]|uniref:Uncharacterized protein n=1 Tax=Hepatospora eriocheir TaxID=1081669 RepID=A0A1X0QCF6_9MICR|nr:hypothetical protein HERIO_670 [Hepatospora eriocheir]